MIYRITIVLISLLGFQFTVLSQKQDTVSYIKQDTQPIEIILFENIFKYYLLTGDNLKVITKKHTKGQGSVIFKADLNEKESEIFRLNFQDLEELYENKCIFDGNQFIIQIKYIDKIKTIQFRNFYLKEADIIIQLINQKVPKQHMIWYDKTELIQELKDCN